VEGRKAHELFKYGDVYEKGVAPPPPAFYYKQRAVTQKARRAAPAAAAFQYGQKPRAPAVAAPAPAFYYDPHQHAYQAVAMQPVCPLGWQRNPRTGRCIKMAGKTYKALYGPPAVPARRPPPVPVVRPPPPPPYNPYVADPYVRDPRALAPLHRRTAGRAATEARRRLTEGTSTLPIGTAAPAPLIDRASLMTWIGHNCTNDRDPITGVPFASADAATLQEVLRLHDRTCTLAGPLNDKVAAEHKAGHVATMPGDPSSHMTLDDFKALRDTMRRKYPGYKIPGRKHQPPPPNWQLYVASDNRSGPEYASVMFVDVTKVIHTASGVQYPVSSVRLDLGFIPLTLTGALCAPQMVVELIQRLSAANRLLTPVAGGWKPVGGFPFKKSYWETDGQERFSRLCKELTRALSTPL
jgi:hypothetical protein